MDEHTLAVLDFPRIREILAGLTQTELGRAGVLAVQPGGDRLMVEREFALTEELLTQGEDPPLGQIGDIRTLVAVKARESTLVPEELLQVRSTLEGLGKVHEYLRRRHNKLPKTSIEVAGIRAFDRLKAQIETAIDETGDIKDDASPELQRIRVRLRRMRNDIVRRMEVIAGANPEMFQDRSVSVRAGRFVLPLKAEARNRFDAVLHDSSDSGHTLFVEPLQLLSEQNEMARLRKAEHDEIQRILREVTLAIRAEADALEAALAGVARLDLIVARKRFAVRFDAVRPVISDRGSVQVINARHPLLQVKKQQVIPLNFVLPDDTGVVLVSGPNAGGKTVAMKTVGLFALMMSSGLFLPASDGTELPLFTNVFAIIGDEQSLEGDLSSFSAHLMRTRQILEQADEQSLVLLDELGGSTSPEEGSALAIAVFEELKTRGALTIATSHLGPLKAFVQTAKGMANAAMEFLDKPTYKLLMGVPGESSALAIAAGLGFPAGVLQRARGYVNQDWLRMSESIKELSAQLDETKRLRVELSQDHERTEALRKEWEAKTAEFRAFEATERKRLQAEQQSTLRQTRREIENLVRDIREQHASRETILKAKQFVESGLERAGTEVTQATQATPELPEVRQAMKTQKVLDTSGRPFVPGDYVLSGMFARPGTIVEVAGKQATVTFGSIRMKLKTSDLQLITGAEPEPEPEPVVPDEDFDPRLDLHGMARSEAEHRLDIFVDRAALHGAKMLSVLHGKGRGALRAMIWDRLRKDSRVAELRVGGPNEGGDGITFVYMKV